MEAHERLITNVRAQIGLAKYQTVITSDNHHIIVDEPASNGGADTGINPQSLLLASLGSCTAITLRMYLDRKQWPVSEINVDVALFNTGLMQSIKCLISYSGDLTAEQQVRLVQIANACPIHKILAKSMVVETALK